MAALVGAWLMVAGVSMWSHQAAVLLAGALLTFWAVKVARSVDDGSD